MKIIISRNFDEINDWIDDDTLKTMREYESDRDNNFEMYDAEAIDPEVPVYEIDEQNEDISDLADYYIPTVDMPDTGDVPTQEVEDSSGIGGYPSFDEDIYIGKEDDIEMPEDEVDESVAESTEIDDGSPDFANTEQALGWAIENKRVVEIFYLTQGKNKGRGGRKLKREVGLSRQNGSGVNIHRIIEPHYIYKAGNGNNIVVTYDRSVAHIRAFIVDNIYDYNFTKNRKTKKDQYFKPRIRVIQSPGKGIKAMKNTNEQLMKMASVLDGKGLKHSSSIVKDAASVVSNYKMAQYVGIQGYWLKNRRCWDNCYRNKRTTSPKTPSQEVWMQCWDEYKDSISNDKSSWGKYAGSDNTVKVGSMDEKAWNKVFASKVEVKVSNGFSRPEAIYAVIEEESKIYSSKLAEASSNLMVLSDTLSENGQKDLGKEMADLSVRVLKEADFAGGGWDKFKDFFRGKPGQIAERLNRLIQSINQIMVNIQGGGATASINVKKMTKVSQPVPPPGSPPAKPAMAQLLNPAQVAMYGKFLSDLRQEMGYLYKMQTKNPNTINITQPAIQAMGAFLTNSDKMFQATGKKTFNREQVMVSLSDLLNAVTGASSAIKSQEQQAPSQTDPNNPDPTKNVPKTDAPTLVANIKKDTTTPEAQATVNEAKTNKQLSQPNMFYLMNLLMQNSMPYDPSSLQGIIAELAK